MRRKSLWKQAMAVSLSVTMLLGLPAEVTFAEESIAESNTEIAVETESAEDTEFVAEEVAETEEEEEAVQTEEAAETAATGVKEGTETEEVTETATTEREETTEVTEETEEATETAATEAEETETVTEELEKETEEESETVEVISEEKNVTAASDFNYEVNEDGTITITGYTGSDADIEIPEEIDGKRVMEIGKSAFESCYNLISVKISNGVTSIGDSAFENCGNLTSIEIPNSVTSIRKEAFERCTDLTSIIIPDSVTSIGEEAFLGCFDLASVTIPSSVTSIERSAFAYCSRLTSIEVDVNNTVYTSEGSNCIIDKRDNTLIQGCNGTIIPNSVKGIGQEAFCGCDITDIVIPDSVTWIGIDAFCNCDELTNITIPNSVISIGYGAFWGCGSLIDITLPDSDTYIDSYAFERCSKLISVKIPSSVKYIGYGVFSYCTQLASIEVDASNPYYTSKGSNCVIEKSSNILIQGCNSTVIPDGVTAIAQYAFSRCEGLTGITIPNSVTSIGQGAFAECSGLTSITIPNSVTSIEENVFKDCENVVIYCYANSYAQQYAVDNNISYQLLKTPSCTHAHTEIRNAKSATVTETGYTGDTYCKDCGKLISSGTTIAKLTVTYTVKFDGNGASSGSMENQKITYASGKALSANKFKKKGYSFKGWNTKNDGSGTTYADKADGSKLTKTDGKTVTLYAQWTANKYTITFNGNGSTSGSTKKLSNCKYGKKYTLTKNGFKKKGYTFTGWNTKKDGSGKTYKNKAEVKNLSPKADGKVTLYAQWKKTKYTITYNLNKGKNNKNNPTSYNITTKTIKLKNPTRKGYTFKGWYSDKKCTKKVMQIKNGSTGNVTLYAKWKKK